MVDFVRTGLSVLIGLSAVICVLDSSVLAAIKSVYI